MSPRSRLALLSCALPFALSLAGCDGAALQGSDGDSGSRDGGRVFLRDLSVPEDARPEVIYNTPRDMGRATRPPDLGKAGPPYPIVLVHGMGGFKNIGPIDYFYGVADALRKDGHDVWVSRQDPINDSEVRGQQALQFVAQVLTETGKAKVNLIGHSQGGFDVRYVASQFGAHVASVVTIASPMDGDPIADLALGTGPVANAAMDALLGLYGLVSGFGSDPRASIEQLSAAGARAFFARHPDNPHVPYYSIAGRSAMSDGGTECRATEPPFIARWDSQRDPLDPILAIPGGLLDGLTPRPVHDGVVTVASAKHGTFLGCIPADHMDEVNQLLGDSPGSGNQFDAIRFYRDLADWLVAKGY